MTDFTRREALGLIAAGSVAACGGDAYREGCAVESRPIHLTATATVDPSSTTGTNAIALKNPHGALPMEILEVKWTMTNADGTANFSTVNPILNAGSIGCQLDLGSIPLTNGAVPIWAYGRAFNELLEAVSATPAINFRWKPDHPLFVPPGAAISAKFKGNSLFKANVSTQLSYGGRSQPAGYRPKRINVPYVMSYTSKAMLLSDADTDQSTETDLLNIFPYPLHVYRMVGRVNALVPGSPTINNENIGFIGSAGPYNLIRVRIVDSKGRPVIRDLTPIRSAFTAQTRLAESQPGKYVLDPGDHLNVIINKLAAPDLSHIGVPVQFVTFISLVAYGHIDV